MNERPVLLPLASLARHLDVPQFMLRDLPPSERAASGSEALYDIVAAKAYLRRQGIIFVNGEAILVLSLIHMDCFASLAMTLWKA